MFFRSFKNDCIEGLIRRAISSYWKRWIADGKRENDLENEVS